MLLTVKLPCIIPHLPCLHRFLPCRQAAGHPHEHNSIACMPPLQFRSQRTVVGSPSSDFKPRLPSESFSSCV